jgi:membrane protein implicated in regulation of membrane protease activity
MLFLLALVLLLFLPSPWNWLAFLVGLVLFCGEVLAWNRTVRHRRPKVDVENLIGRAGTVVRPCRPDGQIRLEGEIWEATCEEGADVGDSVVVTARSGLTLVVHPAPGN